MGLMRWLGRLFGGGAAAHKVEGGFMQGENQDVIIHRRSGFRFPQKLGDYVGVDPNHYDEKGTDVSVGYNHVKLQGLAVTVYVYPVSGTLGAQHEGCKADVFCAHQNVKVLTERDLQTAPNGAPTQGKKALFAFEDAIGEMKLSSISEMWLFVHKGYFIKYRATYPDAMKGEAPGAIETLLKDLAWP